MEATTVERQASDPVGFGRAFGIQFRLLWASRRPLLLLVGLLGILALAGEPWNPDPLARFFHAWTIWVLLVGPFWAFAVFHNEGPSERLYFWSQPVARHLHSLARVAAGIAWLWLAYTVLVVAGILVGLVDGEAWQFAELGVAGWVNYFVAPVIGFLGVTVLTLLVDHPLRWMLGLLLGAILLLSLAHESLGLAAEVEWLLQPLGEPWGLGMTLVGALGTGVSEIEHLIALMSDPTHEYRTSFELSTWWTAMPLWLAFFLGLVLAAATRHPDVFPRWRGRR